MKEYWVNVYPWGIGTECDSRFEAWRRTGKGIIYRIHVKMKEPKNKRLFAQAEV